MIIQYLYLTVFIAWTATSATTDSTGAKPYFSKNDRENCFVHETVVDIQNCIQTIEAEDKKACEKDAYDFAIKHNQKQEPCLRMKKDVYTKFLVKKGEVTYQNRGKLFDPICGGHVCKVNRKGKLYACVTYKDSCK